MSKPVCYMGTYNEHDIRDMHTVVVRYVTDFKSNPDRVIPLYEHPPVPTTERRVFEWQGERKIAEHEYITTAFNYPEAPIGSRDWTLFWQGWKAALNAAPAPTKGEDGC